MPSLPETLPLPPQAMPTDTRRAFVAFSVLLVLAMWLLARPYIGLRHDGELYMAQVLLQIRPEVMLHDIFFQFGSQDRYTIVAPLLVPLYRHLGMAETQILLVVLGQLAVVLATLMLMRGWGLGPTACALGMAAIGVMSHNYGGWNIFSFAERFVTARLFAEPLALAALVAIERRRIVPGLLALAGAMLFHPLAAIPVVIMAWGVLVVRDRRWAWALLGVPLVFVLAVAGIQPMASLLQTFDDPWWQAVSRATGQLFVLDWPRGDWVTLLFDCAVLVVASLVFPAAAVMLRVAAGTTIALVLVSAVGADILNNVLLTQLQLWRAHWVSHLLSLALLPALLVRTWRRDDLRSQIVVLAVMTLAVAANVRYGTEALLVLWAGFALWLYVRRPPVELRVLKVARLASGVALVGTSILVAVTTGGQLASSWGVALGPNHVMLLAVTAPALSLPLVLALLRAQQRGGAAAAGAAVLVVAGLAFGAAHWDQRAPWTRYVETHMFDEHPFEKLIAPTQQVLWWEQSHAVWALLHRPSYYSSQQGAGLVFNRATALEHWRRGALLSPIQIQQEACNVLSALGMEPDPGVACWPTTSAIEMVCSAQGGPDFIVWDRPFDRGVVVKWSPQLAPGTIRDYYLHDCKQVR